jgi:enoyl-CoA hydratase/carnithine racemase
MPKTPIDTVLLRSDDARGVTTLTLNRPLVFNALNEALLTALQTQLDQLAKEPALRVLVMAANGQAFCAGHDLKEMRSEPALGYYQQLFAQCGRMMMSLQRLPVPVIAKVQGMATAAGCQLVAQCDLAVAASDARFATSGVNLGLFCATPSVALSRNLSRKAAFEMLVTGDFINAQEALNKGLINRVADPAQLDEAVESLVSSILSKPRLPIEMGKQLFYRQIETGMQAAYDDAAQTMACNMMDASTSVRRAGEHRPACQPTHLRALRQICIHGLKSPGAPAVQLICTLRNTRSGCGIMAVKRPSAVVTAVRPPGLPLGLAG